MGRTTSLIFDLDGTLYSSREFADEVHRQSVLGLAEYFQVSPEDAERMLTAAKADLTRLHGHEATLSAACTALGGDLRRLHDQLAARLQPEEYLAPDERVIALLERLGEQYNLYIYTNNNRPLTDRIVTRLGLDGLFTGIYTVEDFWRPKPDRLALAKLLAAIGAEPVECLFVGDRFDVDLRLPEEHGSRVFFTDSVERLLELAEFCNTDD